MDRYLVRGHSRDTSTPFKHPCGKTPGCQYKSISKNNLRVHERTCNIPPVEKKLAERLFPCTWDGCTQAFKTSSKLGAHVRSYHTFTPNACPQGFEPEKIYTNGSALQRHNNREHSNRYPTKCLVPLYEDERSFDGFAYFQHLQVKHGFMNAEQRAPYCPDAGTKACWQPTRCPIDGCPLEIKERSAGNSSNHLVKQHGYSIDEAKTIASRGYVMKPKS